MTNPVKPLYPNLGSPYNPVELRRRIVDRLYQNDVDTDTRLDAIDTSILTLVTYKSKVIPSETVPDAANFDLDGGIKLGDIWFKPSTGEISVCNTTHTTGIISGNWTENADVTARADASSAVTQVAAKGSTFYTEASGVTKWPGPGVAGGGDAGQVTVLFWADVGGAFKGDTWVHKNTVDSRYSFFTCIEDYDGLTSGDIGALNHWQSLALDATLLTELLTLLKLDGSRAMTGDLDLGGNNISQIDSINLTGNMTIQGTPSAPDHAVKKSQLTTATDGIQAQIDSNDSEIATLDRKSVV